MTLDVSSIIAARIASANIPNLLVLIPDGETPVMFPCVLISETTEVGNTWEGAWSSSYVVSCITKSDLESKALAIQVRALLDGWGGNGIEDIHHESTIPTRNDATNPVSFSRTMTLIVTYQDLKSP